MRVLVPVVWRREQHRRGNFVAELCCTQTVVDRGRRYLCHNRKAEVEQELLRSKQARNLKTSAIEAF